jgi:hypothetical protein
MIQSRRKPADSMASIASAISSAAMPQDTIMGLPFAAMCLMSGISTSSNDAILYAQTPISARKSAEPLSKAVDRKSIPTASHSSLILFCHSQGVAATRYRS